MPCLLRRGLAAPTIVLLAGLAAGPAALAARPARDRCTRFAGSAVFHTGKVWVVTSELQRDDEVVGYRYATCWAPTGKRRVLWRSAPREDVDFVAKGEWLAWQRRLPGGHWHGVLSSRNVRTGRRGPRYESSSTLAPARNGQIASYVGDSSRAWMAVASNGWFVWGVESRPEVEGGEPASALYMPDGDGGSVRLYGGDFTFLRTRGRTARWRDAQGRTRSAELPSPRPSCSRDRSSTRGTTARWRNDAQERSAPLPPTNAGG
jgi:hypothetical protein